MHDLLIAKLHAYGFSLDALKLMHNYLTGRKQRVKINNSYSSWQELFFGVPQGSILGPLLFNIFLCDLFLNVEDIDIASYADDNTPYTTGKSVPEVIEKLEDTSDKLFKWFSDNGMKANPDKCHLLLSSNDKFTATISQNLIHNTEQQKLLGIIFDSKLSFNEHVSHLCDTASKKLHALARVACFMNIDKRKMIMRSFFLSQFGYCPLVWMNHSRSLNNRINKLHERCLRIIYNDYKSSFCELLSRDQSVTIHQRNLQALAISMYKVKNDLSTEIMKEIFPLVESSYNLRNVPNFRNYPIKTVTYGSETVSFLGPKIWNLVPTDIKREESLSGFKRKIKKWTPQECPCRLCKNYIQHVGFI